MRSYHCKKFTEDREKREHLRRDARPRKAKALEDWGIVFKERFLQNPGGLWLTVIIDGCRLYTPRGSAVHVLPIRT